MKIRSLAFEIPSTRVARCVPPAPGMIPSAVSGRPSFVTSKPIQVLNLSEIGHCWSGTNITRNAKVTSKA